MIPKQRHKHRIRQMIINYILSFILAVSIVTLIVSTMGKFSFATERAIVHASEKQQYYYSLKNEIEQKAMDYAVPFGIDRSCIKNVFGLKEVKLDVMKALHEKVANQKEIIDIGEIERRITKNVEKKEGKLTAAQKKSLSVYIKKVTDMYLKKIHYPTEDFMATIINESTSIVIIAIPLSAFVMLLCIFYLIVSRHYAYHGIRYVAYGLLGGGGFCAIMFAAMIASGSVYNYNMSDSYMKKFYVYWIGHPMLMSVVCGIAVLFIGFVSIFLVYRQKYRIR